MATGNGCFGGTARRKPAEYGLKGVTERALSKAKTFTGENGLELEETLWAKPSQELDSGKRYLKHSTHQQNKHRKVKLKGKGESEKRENVVEKRKTSKELRNTLQTAGANRSKTIRRSK